MSLNIKFRKLRPSDYKRVIQLLKEAKLWRHYFNYERFKSMVKSQNTFCPAAVINGKVVGFMFSFHDGGFLGYCWKLTVDKNYRRLGIAYKLHELVDRHFESHKPPIYKAFAHVKKTRKAILNFIKKRGWKIQKNYYFVYPKADKELL